MVREGPRPITVVSVASWTPRATMWGHDQINSPAWTDDWWEAVVPLVHETVSGQQTQEEWLWSIKFVSLLFSSLSWECSLIFFSSGIDYPLQ